MHLQVPVHKPKVIIGVHEANRQINDLGFASLRLLNDFKSKFSWKIRCSILRSLIAIKRRRR